MSESGEPASPALPSSDAELIKAVASGNAAAYATLHERHVAAARILAREVAPSFAEAEEVLSETFVRLNGVLRGGDGDGASDGGGAGGAGGSLTEVLRPFLLTAVRRVAQERSAAAGTERSFAGGTGTAAGGGDDIHSLGEPLFADPEAADLEGTRLALAFRALPERQRAAAWYLEIEQADPAEAAVLLGLTVEGVAGLRDQALVSLRRAYLKQYASGLAREDCRAVADKLDQHLGNATRGGDEAMVQRHLRGCRECRAAVIELSASGRSLRTTVAPIFLGPPAAAYLAAVMAPSAPPGRAEAGLSRLLEIAQAPRRLLRATRQQQAFAGGIALLAVVGVTGLALTLASNSAPQPAAQHPAAIAPARPSAAVPSAAPQATPAQPVATTMPVKKAKAAASPSPAPTSPAPTPSPSPSPSPSPAPSPTPSPTPTPSPPPHHRHHRPPNTA
jgi:DNA-directed RNA polymerase specialized sigma24 family protein